MARAILRQTFIALRARRAAYRIAADFLYDEPIDVEAFACRSCGRQIRPRVVSTEGSVRCGVCGVRNVVPPHLRTRQAPPARVLGERDRWEADYESWRWRRRTVLFFLIACAIAVVASVI